MHKAITLQKPGAGFPHQLAAAMVALITGVLWATAIPAGEFGTAAEARAMLERAVAELTADQAAALAKFNSGADRFRDRDLYPFCAGPDGITTAHPSVPGTNLRERVDVNGKPFGEEMYRVAKAGVISEVSYMWPRPGSEEHVEKVSFITLVGDQLCGVGYYVQ